MRHFDTAANLGYRPTLLKSYYLHTCTRDIKKHQKAAGQRAISAKAGIQLESSNCCFSHSLKGTKTTSTQAPSLSTPLSKWEKLTFAWLGPALAPTPLATSSAKEVGERRKPCPTAEGHGQRLGMPLVLRLPLSLLLKSCSTSGTLLLEGGRWPDFSKEN